MHLRQSECGFRVRSSKNSTRLQVGRYRQKLLLRPHEDLVHSHLLQRRSTSPLCPALEIPQIDRSNRARGHAKLPAHSAISESLPMHSRSYRRAYRKISSSKTLIIRCYSDSYRESYFGKFHKYLDQNFHNSVCSKPHGPLSAPGIVGSRTRPKSVIWFSNVCNPRRLSLSAL